jgi:hypothetical protein
MHQLENLKSILLSTACFPPISYVKSILNSDKIYIEQFENYIKQSYRNRYIICAANGLMSLSIPVTLATNKKILIKDVQIDYDTNWQKQHFKSIESAYRSAPFYEYLIDDFKTLFNAKYNFLIDYNLLTINTILNILEIDKKIELTNDFEKLTIDKIDLRNEIHPKKENEALKPSKKYPQVFESKFGFQKDLSCLDLLFNLGSESYSYLIDKY